MPFVIPFETSGGKECCGYVQYHNLISVTHVETRFGTSCQCMNDLALLNIPLRRSQKPSPPSPGQVADVPLFVSLYKDTFSIFRDLCGDSLHRRGYRDAMHKSPLNEAAAAGILLMAGWKDISGPEGLGECEMMGAHLF